MVGLLERTSAKETAPIGKVLMVAKPGGPNTGVGRYVHMLLRNLTVTGLDVQRISPEVPPLPASGYAILRRLNLDLEAFLTNYPVWAHYPEADLCHLSSQNLASLLMFRSPPTRTIVTVHDIIPYVLRDDPELCPYRGWADRLFDRVAMSGLKRASHLVADSKFTMQCLMTHVGIPADKIDVVYLGIDHKRFRPREVPDSFRARYGLSPDQRYLIYVGSEDPRKNLGTLLDALAILRRGRDDVELIKIGQAHFEQERTRLSDHASRLGIRAAVRFFNDVPDEDLPFLYSAADVCVMPSLYEGFGFPVLEAMACGTPVVCSNAASLPELAGDAALLFHPGWNAAQALATSVSNVLEDQDLYDELSTRGRKQAANFRWDEVANRMHEIYRAFTRPVRQQHGMNGGGRWL